MKIIQQLLKRKLIILFSFLFIVTLGIFSIQQLKIEMMPDIKMDGATVWLHSNQVSSLDMVKNITEPIEQRMNRVEGIANYKSDSSVERAKIDIQFEQGKGENVFPELERALREAEAGLPALERMDIYQWTTGYRYDLILDIYDGDIKEMSHFVETELLPELRALDQVGEIDVSGVYEEEIIVTLDSELLEEKQIELAQVVQAIRGSDRNVAIGELENEANEPVLRWVTEIGSREDVGEVFIRTPVETVALKDIAVIEQREVVKEENAWKNGSPDFITIQLGTYNAYTVLEMTAAVSELIDRLRTEHELTFEIEEMFSRGDFIQNSILDGGKNVLYGGILAFIVILLFLRSVRASLIIGVSIPLSVLLTFTIMSLLGYNINLLTVIALGLGIGMIVDSSIVILESIVRHKKLGKSNSLAAIEGTKEVFSAVIASMLTTVVVFLPIGLLSGDVGTYILTLSIVIIITLISSLFVAFTFIPVLAETFMQIKPGKTMESTIVYKVYETLLSWICKRVINRLAVMVIFILLLSAAIPLMLYKVPTGLMPDVFDRQSEIVVNLQDGLNMEDHEEVAENIHSQVMEIPDIAAYKVYSLDDKRLRMFINMVSNEEATLSQNEVNSRILDSLRAMKEEGIEDASLTLDAQSPSYPIVLNLNGDNIDTLVDWVQMINEDLLEIEGISSSFIDTDNHSAEQHIVMNRDQIKEDHMDPQQIMEYLQVLFHNQAIGQYEIDGSPMTLYVKTDHEVLDAEDLLAFEIPTPQGNEELRKYISVIEREYPLFILREDGKWIMSIRAFNENRDLGSIGREIDTLVDEYKTRLPNGVELTVGGKLSEQQQAMQEMILIIMIAIVLVYAVMSIQFNNIFHPLVVISILPMTVIGVIVGLFLTQKELNVLTAMGIVILIGIVLNNAILLIDRIKQLRAEDESLSEAVIRGCKNRLYPIFITTFTTVFGMLPLALSSGDGSNFQSPLATVVIFGLLFSTFVTLLLIPSLYLFLEDITGMFKRKKTKVKKEMTTEI